jgi:hypothetical protein
LESTLKKLLRPGICFERITNINNRNSWKQFLSLLCNEIMLLFQVIFKWLPLHLQVCLQAVCMNVAQGMHYKFYFIVLLFTFYA